MIAVALQEEALEFDREVLKTEPGDRADVAVAMSSLGDTYSVLGRYDDELAVQKETLVIREAVLGVDHKDTLKTRSRVAHTLTDLGRYTEALQLCAPVLEMQQLVHDAPHHKEITTSMSNMATIYFELGDYQKAVELERESLRLQKQRTPDAHCLSLNLAGCFLALGLHDEALKAYSAVLDQRRTEYQNDHPLIADSMIGLAGVCVALKRHDEALPLSKEGLAVYERVSHPRAPHAMTILAAAYCGLRRHDEALELQQKALALQEQHLPPDRRAIAVSMAKLAEIHVARKQFAAALPVLEDALVMLHTVPLHPTHTEIVATKRNVTAVHDLLEAAGHSLASSGTKSRLLAKLQRRKAAARAAPAPLVNPSPSSTTASPDPRSVDDLLQFINGGASTAPVQGNQGLKVSNGKRKGGKQKKGKKN